MNFQYDTGHQSKHGGREIIYWQYYTAVRTLKLLFYLTFLLQVAMLQKLAKENMGKMLFVTINTDEDDHKRILEFFGITESELPTFRAIQLGEDMAKFKPDDDKIEAENIKAFVAKFLAGELKQHLMSDEIPEDWEATGVMVLVCKNFT